MFLLFVAYAINFITNFPFGDKQWLREIDMPNRRDFLKVGAMMITGGMLLNEGVNVMAADKKFPKMYESWKIDNLPVKNRMTASAMFEFAAENGKIDERVLERYDELARGGSGLIITGMEGISPAACIGPAMIQTGYDGYEDDMRKIADIVHGHGAKLFVQLNHAGYKTNWKNGGDKFGVCEKKVSDDCTYRQASKDDIRKVIDAFAQSAARCKAAGCDGVEIHYAHGFLLNTFLSPYFNHRTDEYGGNRENRARLPLEVYDAIRGKVGNDFIVAAKIPFSDLVEPSISPEDCVWTCKELEKRGLDMIEVTSGISYDGGPSSFTPHANVGKPQGKFLAGAEKIADNVTIPVVSVCGYRTPEFVENILQEGKIAAIAFGRPFVREPNLPNRWLTDASPAKCISCNGCYTSKGIISCVFSRKG